MSNIQEEVAALIETHKKNCEALFRRETDALFNKYSRLKSFGFQAYIPYFSDGDICTFSAHINQAKINGVGSYNEDEEEPDEGENLYTATDAEAGEITESVANLLGDFDQENFYQFLFGDEFEVTITKDDITVDGYSDHD